MGRRKVRLLSMFIVLLCLNACAQVESVKHIEAFIAETTSKDDKGFYTKTGYKKVNSVSIIRIGKHFAKSDVKMIEDYYDLDGNYIKTEISHTTLKRSNIHFEEDGGKQTAELHQPSTILIPDENLENFRSSHLSDEEKALLENHVLSLTRKYLGNK